jgi:hypothetical protein
MRYRITIARVSREGRDATRIFRGALPAAQTAALPAAQTATLPAGAPMPEIISRTAMNVRSIFEHFRLLG